MLCSAAFNGSKFQIFFLNWEFLTNRQTTGVCNNNPECCNAEQRCMWVNRMPS